MIRYLHRYILHVKRQNSTIQEIHAIVFAFVASALLILLFIGGKKVIYNIFHPFKEEEMVSTVQAPLESPMTSFRRLFSDTREKVLSASKTSMFDLFDTKTAKEEGMQFKTITPKE